MKTIALIAAAGSGKRMESGQDAKPFLELGGKPILAYVLERFVGSAAVDEVVLVVKEKYIDKAAELVALHGFGKIAGIFPGADSRTGSVNNGIEAIEAENDDIVVIHDGVRPFITEPVIRAAVDSAAAHGAAVVGVPCTATIKSVGKGNVIEGTPDRKKLWEAQTPQAFRYGIIKKAYGASRGKALTDDSCLVERMGHKVRMVMGDVTNIKVTVPADLTVAEAILNENRDRV